MTKEEAAAVPAIEALVEEMVKIRVTLQHIFEEQVKHTSILMELLKK